MRILSHTVIAAESGRTAKELLRGLWHISGSLLSRLKFRGAITVNGAPVTVNHLLHTGDILQADVSDRPGENPHILQSDSFHAVNRLDRGTTGIMAVAKTGFVHARCMTLLHTNDFQRDYRAVCDGLPPQPEGDIDLPLGRAEGSLLKRCPDPHGQSAHTHYQVLSAANGRALLRLTPTTGRTHQLRVHMAAIGCPLTGDWLYGTEDRTLIARPALHSYHLRMVHPVTGAVIDITALLPEDMHRLL